MTRIEEKEKTRSKVLNVCVKLFREVGYSEITISEIVKEAGMSFPSFRNIFGTKEGVLLELLKTVCGMKKSILPKKINPLFRYCAETAVRTAMAEFSESLREVLTEAYSKPALSEYICLRDASENEKIFAEYNSNLTQSDFYEIEIAVMGIMRAYTARKCDQYFTLEKKLTRILTASLKIYNVPKDKAEEAVNFALGLDLKALSEKTAEKLFEFLSGEFDQNTKKAKEKFPFAEDCLRK